MTPNYKEYRADGLENDMQFKSDFDFGSDLLNYVEELHSPQMWYIHSCNQVIGQGFVAVFRSRDWASDRISSMTIHVVPAVSVEDDNSRWAFSVVSHINL